MRAANIGVGEIVRGGSLALAGFAFSATWPGALPAFALNASGGLITVHEYNIEGDRTGTLVKEGSGGKAYYVAAADYYGGSNGKRVVVASDAREAN